MTFGKDSQDQPPPSMRSTKPEDSTQSAKPASSTNSAHSAGIIVIGNEVLSGKVSDINSTWLMTEFRELGLPVRRVAIVPDEADVITAHVQTFSRSFDVVFTTGGVGPTHDDITFASVAAAFDEPLAANVELERAIREFFVEPKDIASYLPMAMVPTSTELIWADDLPFPVTRVRNVYVMPGEPTVLRKKFTGIREMFRQRPFALRRLFTTLGEGALADMLRRLQDEHPEVEIGSYPVYENDDYEVQVTIESKDAAAVEKVFRRLDAEIPPEAIWRVE